MSRDYVFLTRLPVDSLPEAACYCNQRQQSIARIHVWISSVLYTAVAAIAPCSSTPAIAEAPPATRSPDVTRQIPEGFHAATSENDTIGAPRRIVHSRTQIPFILVPGGTYSVGDDSVPYSKAVAVTVGDFYMSERQLSHSDIAALLRIYWSAHETDVSKSGMSGHGSAVASLATQDATLMRRVEQVRQDIRMFPPLYDDRELSSAYASLLKVLRQPPPLNSEDREKLWTYLDLHDKALDRLSEQVEKPFSRASFATAEFLARQASCRLPTEIEWEVAARWSSREMQPVTGMLDAILEWCSDYYCYDAFEKLASSRTVAPPQEAKLTEAQLVEHADDSALRLRTTALARHMRVLRGGTLAKREFGYGRSKVTLLALGSQNTNRGVRLVVPAASIATLPRKLSSK